MRKEGLKLKNPNLNKAIEGLELAIGTNEAKEFKSELIGVFQRLCEIDSVNNMTVKEFTDQDFIAKRNIADLGEVGEFYAEHIDIDEIDSCFNRMVVFGKLLKGEEEKEAFLNITLPQEIDVLSLPAGKLFHATWEEWQIETF